MLPLWPARWLPLWPALLLACASPVTGVTRPAVPGIDSDPPDATGCDVAVTGSCAGYNVLLITLDTWPKFGPIGEDNLTHTPVIARYFAEATVVRGRSSAAWTSPSGIALGRGIAAADDIVTSFLPIVNEPIGHVEDSETTAYEWLSEYGDVRYITGNPTFLLATNAYQLDSYAEYADGGLAQAVTTLVPDEQALGGRPFFTHLHVGELHDPLRDYAGVCASQLDPLPRILADAGGTGMNALMIYLTVHWASYSTDEQTGILDWVRCLQGEEAAWVDEILAGLLHSLDSEGLLDRTLVAFSADHGEGFGTVPALVDYNGDGSTVGEFLFGHSNTLSPTLTTIPMAFWVRGGEPREVDVTLDVSQIWPTLLDTLSLPIPPAMTALPLSAADAGIKRGFVCSGETDAGVPLAPSFSVLDPGDNMLYTKHRDLGFQIYDLASDPWGSVDLAATVVVPTSVIDVVEEMEMEAPLVCVPRG
ncbi:MAG: hypothetical protein EXR69_15405 [Myxococcales bacterium]|nr:hypothetical protein [Myxococcales bacterium]